MANDTDTVVLDMEVLDCRHEDRSFTSLEVLYMILVQFGLLITYWLTGTLLWMLKVRFKARNYLTALPNRRILNFVKKEQRAPFEFSATDEKSSMINNNNSNTKNK